MRSILKSLSTVVLAVSLMAPALAETPKLTVYTYDSFTAEWGPGPRLEAAFEADCGCDLEFVALEDAVAILSRLRFEGASSTADIALGLDTSLIAEAKDTGLFAEHTVALDGLSVPGNFSDPVFVPYDYGFFAFIYDDTRVSTPPGSLKELVEESSATLLLQDPRTSSPGLGLMLWVRKVYGDEAASAWEKLAPRIVTVTPGWSEAYGLFQKGEADMVLSYTTSPAYHITAENETRYRAAAFAEGHYAQIEVAARLASSKHPELADRFLQFLVSEEAQAEIPGTQWMYPVRKVPSALPDSFSQLVQVKTPLGFSPEEVKENRKSWVAEWQEALSR